MAHECFVKRPPGPWKYCPYCGVVLPPAPATAHPPGVCRVCGKAAPGRSTFCEHCYVATHPTVKIRIEHRAALRRYREARPARDALLTDLGPDYTLRERLERRPPYLVTLSLQRWHGGKTTEVARASDVDCAKAVDALRQRAEQEGRLVGVPGEPERDSNPHAAGG